MTNKVAYCRNDTGKVEYRINGTRPIIPSLLHINAVTAITVFYGVLLSASCEPNDRRDAVIVNGSSNGTQWSDAPVADGAWLDVD